MPLLVTLPLRQDFRLQALSPLSELSPRVGSKGGSAVSSAGVPCHSVCCLGSAGPSRSHGRCSLAPHTPPLLGLPGRRRPRAVRSTASLCRRAAESELHGPRGHRTTMAGPPWALSQAGRWMAASPPRQQGGVSEARPQRACGRLTEDSGSPHGQLSGWGSAGRSYLLPILSGQWPEEASEPGGGQLRSLSSRTGVLPAASTRSPVPATLSAPSPPAPTVAPAGKSRSLNVGARAKQPPRRSTGRRAE